MYPIFPSVSGRVSCSESCVRTGDARCNAQAPVPYNGLFLCQRPIQAEGAGAARGKTEKQEAIRQGQLTLVLNRPRTLRVMHHEVRDAHFSRSQKCRGRHKEAEDKQQATAKFDQASNEHQTVGGRRSGPAEQAKELLRSVASEQETDNNSQQRVDRFTPFP